MNKESILIADDDPSILAALKLQLKSEGFDCATASSPAEVEAAIKQKAFSLLLIDLNYQLDTTSGEEGLQLISTIRQQDEFVPIVVMTGWATIEIAVKAMQLGANDFIEKPCDNNRLLITVKNLIKFSHSLKSTQLLANEQQIYRQNQWPETWVCESPAMQSVMDIFDRVANTDINILITGENGTGKSLLAQLIHQHSARNEGSLVNVNMGAINEQVFESELFGHVKGAFTDAKQARLGRIELANQGTLFMDEVANIPLSQQAKLLRVLESGEFEKLGSSQTQQANVRVISATNSDLSQMERDGLFRKDLLFRLNSIEITLPRLTERSEDILPLAHSLLKKYQKNVGVQKRFTGEAEQAMLSYDWPGNVRELSHVIERAVLLSKTSDITDKDLMLSPSQSEPDVPIDDDWAGLTMEQAEKKLIALVMRKFHGNAKKAALSLGYSKSAFYRRLEKFDL